MRSLIKITFAAGLSLLAATGYAVDWSVSLPEEEVAKLPDNAKEYYLQAMTQIDKINYDGGVVLLAEAAEAAPESGHLQFFTHTRARDRAEVYYSAASYSPVPDNMDYSSPPWRTSEVFYEISESALRRLIERPELTAEQKRRLQKEMAAVEAGRSTLSERDKERFEGAVPIVMNILRARKSEMGVVQQMMDLGIQVEQPALPDGVLFGEEEAADEMDPFEALPGEHIEDFLPPPPTPVAGQPGGAYGFGGDPALIGAGGAPTGFPGESPFGAPQGGQPAQPPPAGFGDTGLPPDLK